MALVSKQDVAVGKGSFVATAGAAIVAGDLVAYKVDASGDARYYTVVPADFNSSPIQNCIAGFAVGTQATVGGEVEVCFWGFLAAVKCTGTVTAGDRLCLDSAGAAGTVISASTPDNASGADALPQIIAVATADNASAAVAVFVRVHRAQ